ncbi:MAG: hypothetical protein CSA13_00130 [Clostridiales bacterium]|nr:MAG: hypothetical protein CSA13_00130 [Clostridiales bacterium]
MPLRPIDLQTVIPKVSSVAKSRQALVQQEANALINVQFEREKQEAHEREVVQSLSQSDKLAVDYKREEPPKEKRKKRQRKDKDANRDDSEVQQHIDIKI